jgi:hypothetical protein
MDDLVTWLRAQLDEDERVAQAAGSRYETPASAPAILAGFNAGPQVVEFAQLWTPARVLAEVDAKRRLLDLHDPYARRGGWPVTEYQACSYCAGLCHSGSGLACDQPVDALYPCETVRLVATAYAGRPGYRDQWRPDHVAA